MHHPVLATVITQSQMHVQIKHSLAHLQDLIPTLAGININAKHTSQSRDYYYYYYYQFCQVTGSHRRTTCKSAPLHIHTWIQAQNTELAM